MVGYDGCIRPENPASAGPPRGTTPPEPRYPPDAGDQCHAVTWRCTAGLLRPRPRAIRGRDRAERRRFLLACGLAIAPLVAWNPPVDTAGPITTRLEVPATLTSLQPITGTLHIINDSSRDVPGSYELRVIDGWTVTPAKASFTARAQNRVTVSFTITPAAKTYSALYPVHAFVRFEQDATKYEAHPIAIIAMKVALGSRRGEGGAIGAADIPPIRPGLLGRAGGYAVWLTPTANGHSIERVLFRGARGDLWFDTDPSLRRLTLMAGIEDGALRVHVSTDVSGSEIALGRWSAQASRIYAGQGNVIDHPEPFHLGADGHRL